ncbi:hypothetical protein [Pontibacillus marinus]|uniref:Uncharacterized protein n=1 Tax=Pontibacillus marinus BH030004 = DSM 16465 TaxID=1385511 RepID=A0A0A5GK01_9BACI|nr:hypothetical protein [Pontibacillus marinus]KGX91513.1 hypothetical protein N783_07565 [Pontibacillus marinus BH030004 = DSM 16465]
MVRRAVLYNILSIVIVTILMILQEGIGIVFKPVFIVIMLVCLPLPFISYLVIHTQAQKNKKMIKENEEMKQEIEELKQERTKTRK